MKEGIRNSLTGIFGKNVRIDSIRSTGGGCINQTQVLILSNKERVFLKSNDRPPSGFFAAEANGLALLRGNANGLRVPRVLALQPGNDPHYLLLEYIEETGADAGYCVNFARSLATLHRTAQDHYGLDHDNFIGKTAQHNAVESDPIVFYREHRFRFQQRLARTAGLLPKSVDARLDKLWDKLDTLINVAGERPALVHGDLWSGNHFPAGDNACIVDPAVYFGLRESDLAMTEMFGRLPQEFYDAYAEAFPLNPGYAERKQLFNLYHLLNHLNLFGGSYLSSVEQVAAHFTG
jgi:fructosamine-3-kinase